MQITADSIGVYTKVFSLSPYQNVDVIRQWSVQWCLMSGPSCLYPKAKKNKLFDCPLITFQRVGRSVGNFFFFFFTFKCWMLKLCSIWTDSYNSTSLHRPPGCSATWTRFTSLPEHVMSSPVIRPLSSLRQKGFRPIRHLDRQPEFTWRRHRLLCQAVTNSV